MKTIIRTLGGAHLYGTATEQSDRDELAVHIADARAILLGRVKPVLQTTTGDQNVKNRPGDIDVESYEIATWLKMLGDGEIRAYDLLFAPAPAVLECLADTWAIVRPIALAQMNRRVKGFVGYCRRQAAKYGVKGSRVAAVKGVLQLLADLPPHSWRSNESKLAEHEQILKAWADGTEHARVGLIEGSNIPHLVVCDRACPLTNRVRHAVEIYARIEQEYGVRARLAERNEGIDWKAMSHAVRVGTQTIELLTTQHITFPRPDRELLLQIKLGQLPYAEVAAHLEQLIDQIEALAPNSPLPDAPNRELADDLVYAAHEKVVLDSALKFALAANN